MRNIFQFLLKIILLFILLDFLNCSSESFEEVIKGKEITLEPKSESLNTKTEKENYEKYNTDSDKEKETSTSSDEDNCVPITGIPESAVFNKYKLKFKEGKLCMKKKSNDQESTSESSQTGDSNSNSNSDSDKQIDYKKLIEENEIDNSFYYIGLINLDFVTDDGYLQLYQTVNNSNNSSVCEKIKISRYENYSEGYNSECNYTGNFEDIFQNFKYKKDNLDINIVCENPKYTGIEYDISYGYVQKEKNTILKIEGKCTDSGNNIKMKFTSKNYEIYNMPEKPEKMKVNYININESVSYSQYSKVTRQVPIILPSLPNDLVKPIIDYE